MILIRVACFYWLCHQISQRRLILTRFSNKEQSVYFRKQALENVFQNQSLSVDCAKKKKINLVTTGVQFLSVKRSEFKKSLHDV